MYRKYASVIRIIAVMLLSVLLLSACLGGSGGTIRYYLVNPVDFSAASTIPAKKLAIEIIDLHVPQPVISSTGAENGAFHRH